MAAGHEIQLTLFRAFVQLHRMGHTRLLATGAAFATLLLATPLTTHAQTAAAAPDPAQAMPPAKIAEFQARFKKGNELQAKDKWAEALKVYEDILSEQPQARGSLLCAGMCSLRTGDNAKAIEYLDRFRALEPKDPQGMIYALQAAQALKKTPKVEALRREMIARRNDLIKNPPATAGPALSEFMDNPLYPRERVADPLVKDAYVVISEAFDYKQPPNAVYMAQQFLPNGDKGRQLFISYEKVSAAALKAQDPNAKDTDVFFFVELFPAATNENEQANIAKQQLNKPDYSVARAWMLETLKAPATRVPSATPSAKPAPGKLP